MYLHTCTCTCMYMYMCNCMNNYRIKFNVKAKHYSNIISFATSICRVYIHLYMDKYMYLQPIKVGV